MKTNLLYVFYTQIKEVLPQVDSTKEQKQKILLWIYKELYKLGEVEKLPYMLPHGKDVNCLCCLK